jgi:ADP-ribose pyrophosphatase YjhB (NUDIX family)
VARIDYFNDPNAPKANSIVPSVTAIVPNERGELLLVHNTDNDLWALPGGGMDVGESMADTVVREVKEETGIDVEVTGVVGIYTNPNHVMAYDDGEVRQQCSICFTTRLLGGQLATSSETSEVEFVAPDRLDSLNIHPSMRLRIDHYLERRSAPTLAEQAHRRAAAGFDRSPPAARGEHGQWLGAPDHRAGSGAGLPRCAAPRSSVGRPARWSCRRR